MQQLDMQRIDMQHFVKRDQQCELARRILVQSLKRWGKGKPTVLIGRHPRLSCALERAVRFAASDRPVLITGETGVGKESFARALYLSSPRIQGPFIAVNCAQYQGEQLVASQLFGHKKGSFTGADSARRGVFQEGHTGIVFLDEIGDLPLSAQAMVLRVISEGEVVPVGATQAQQVDVKLISATNHDLKRLVAEGRFREDLYYRLCGLLVAVPPLRERGRDWELIADHYLERLGQQHAARKHLAMDAMRSLRSYHWPGNVRELINLVDLGFHLSSTAAISLEDLGVALEETSRIDQLERLFSSGVEELCSRMMESGAAGFWELLHEPYMRRDLNRSQVQEVISFALNGFAKGSYKQMLLGWGVEEGDYLKAMDFLRHHRLKPQR